MWSGRFRQPLDPEFERWQRSFPFDQRLIEEEMCGQPRACSRAGHRRRVIAGRTGGDAARTGVHRAAGRANPEFLHDEEAEDVHHFVEKQLVALIGETGSSCTADAAATSRSPPTCGCTCARSIDNLQRGLARAGAGADRARGKVRRGGHAVLHAPAARPSRCWWRTGCWHTPRCFCATASRLADCRKRLNLCPLGSGAVAGATLALDREAMAADLGFDRLPRPTAWMRPATAILPSSSSQALSLLAMHLSRLAEEMILFSTREYRLRAPAGGFSTGSSAMPQKQNPDALELIRGKAGRVIGAATALLVTVKGLPLAYNKDMQETQEPVFAAAETMQAVAADRCGLHVAPCEFDCERMHAAASSGFMNAMAAATTWWQGRALPPCPRADWPGRAVVPGKVTASCRTCLSTTCAASRLKPARTFTRISRWRRCWAATTSRVAPRPPACGRRWRNARAAGGVTGRRLHAHA